MSACELVEKLPDDAHNARRERVAVIVDMLKEKNLLDEDHTAVDVINFDTLRAIVAKCHTHLPSQPFFHFFAVKSCPLTGVMKELLRLGMGAECASITEVEHALAMGFPAEKVCFDSPAKTKRELVSAITKGCVVNMDGAEEMARVNGLFAAGRLDAGEVQRVGNVGMRINPCQSAGTILITSTAHAGSKFGLQVNAENRAEMVSLLRSNRWIRGLHMHVGSQGVAIEQIVMAARAVVDIALAVGAMEDGAKQIQWIDLGGGLSIDYLSDALPAFDEYARLMKASVPELFDDTFAKVYTEFGRSIVGKAGDSYTYVETAKYTVQDGKPRRTILCHVGSNHMLRPAYKPDKYAHRITVVQDPANVEGDDHPWELHDIGGPLCFSGDVIGRRRSLPKTKCGDTLVIHDTASYCYAMYSRYNSRPAHPVVAIESVVGQNGSGSGEPGSEEPAAKRAKSYPYEMTVINAGETLEDLIRFWS